MHHQDEGLDLSGTPLDPVNGFSEPASACINKAGWIAYVLNHPRMNAAHLVLAMSLDKKAALGLKSRGLDVEQLRQDMMHMVLAARWDYTDDQAEPTPVIRTTSDLSNILDAAKRRASERDNQPAALTDLFDVLVSLNAEGKLVPPKPEAKENAAISSGLSQVNERFTDVLGKLGELQTLVDQGFKASASHFDTAMAASTRDLLAQFARQSEEDEVETPPVPSASTTSTGTRWSNPFRIALLGLL